ncbi:hypothetical protein YASMINEVIRUS_631 [Yasminevirus sp. GU-2018]|uniref:Uncharacterized protein n=1 Tax=Yasminevirus sp. GU-2018 TaxID=2420051 RepID=A0A5K0U820_9VIRU|nr:hypothetical protein YASMINEVIRUS_631 [Yasminevirus sp. GU-2018]
MGRIPLDRVIIRRPTPAPSGITSVIRDLNVGDLVRLNIASSEGKSDDDGDTMPAGPPPLCAAPSNYGFREFKLETGLYRVLSTNARPGEDSGDLRAIIAVPVRDADTTIIVPARDIYSAKVDDTTYYITYVITTDGHIRDSEHWTVTDRITGAELISRFNERGVRGGVIQHIDETSIDLGSELTLEVSSDVGSGFTSPALRAVSQDDSKDEFKGDARLDVPGTVRIEVTAPTPRLDVKVDSGSSMSLVSSAPPTSVVSNVLAVTSEHELDPDTESGMRALPDLELGEGGHASPTSSGNS